MWIRTTLEAGMAMSEFIQFGQQLFLAFLGLSAGVTAAAGLFAFIVELGVIVDFADRTHTGGRLLFYEDCAATGGIIGSICYIFMPEFSLSDLTGTAGQLLLTLFGLLSGIFAGCWAMALAEVLKVFPVFARRGRIVRHIAPFIISAALGKGLGALFFFQQGW